MDRAPLGDGRRWCSDKLTRRSWFHGRVGISFFEMSNIEHGVRSTRSMFNRSQATVKPARDHALKGQSNAHIIFSARWYKRCPLSGLS